MSLSKEVNVNLHIQGYTSRVLGVIKEKHGLKDKSQALDFFAKQYGNEYVDLEVKEEVIKKMIEDTDKYITKHGFKRYKLEDLDKLLEE